MTNQQDRRWAPPSVIAIRSNNNGNSHHDRSERSGRSGRSGGGNARHQRETKTGLDLALAGVVRVEKMNNPDGDIPEPVHTAGAGISRLSQRSRVSLQNQRNRSMVSGVSFALEEEDEEEEESEEEEREEEKEDITSHCDLSTKPEHQDNKSTNSCSVVMPDIDVEEEEHMQEYRDATSAAAVEEERTNFLEDITEALQKYAKPRNTTTCSSSDYWKGLLVGLFLCQAIFVPLWASWSVSGTSSSGFLGFFSLIFRRLVVGTVAGAGFVIIGVVAIEYDKALHREMEELRQNKALREEVDNLRFASAEQPRTRTPTPRRRSTHSTPRVLTPPTEVSTEEEQNHTSRSVSLTAPSTSSHTGTMEGDNNNNNNNNNNNKARREEKDTMKSKSPDPVLVEKRPVEVKGPMEAPQTIVNHTPDTLLCETTLDLCDASQLTPMPNTNNNTIKESSITQASSSYEQQEDSMPEFYPDVTVLVAHVSGFTAWSSQRSPDQVFTLLEKLHHRFDEAAKRLEITKVEATSESYVAVTGAPLPQTDHAIRMVKFSKSIMQSMVNIVTALEGTLGPGTMDLRLRIGIHSGSVTAGALGGRFQIFGNTLEIATTMETTSFRHRIQVSEATAELLCQAEKSDWIQKREDNIVTTHGGDAMPTYFVVITTPLSTRAKPTSNYHGQRSNKSLRSLRSAMSGVTANSALASDQKPKVPKRRKVWDDGEDNFILSLPPMSRTAKNKRLVGWVIKLLHSQLKKLVVQRGSGRSARNEFEITDAVLSRVCDGDIPMDEVVDVFSAPKPDHYSDRSTISSECADVNLDANVASQLREMVNRIASLYRDENPFSNFEHASNVTMAVQKLLSRCISHDDDDAEFETSSKSMASTRSASRHYMSGVACDALSQFAIFFAALSHDCGHEGLSSRQLSRLNPKLSEQYQHESVAEQNSIDLAWQTVMDAEFKDLQRCLFTNEHDVRRFRQVLVNTVLATDLFNGEAETLRNQRWDRAFHPTSCDGSGVQEDDADLKATVVIECLVQASDISHCMQHFKVYQKWNERFFREKSIAFDAGRSSCNPVETWFQEELDFLDNYAIPLAKKLSESKVFGVASNECLNHSLANRKLWCQKGEQMVKEMFQRYCKRKEMEIGGFTNEEINNFTSKELEYIMKKLVEKGRNNGTNQVDAEKGQNDAAQAWLDALEIYERSPAANEISDRSVIFPIYSGLFVWIKGEKIPQDPDGYFELNVAQKFVRESKLHLDPIHHTRALAMLSEVYGRQGNYNAAIKEFHKLKDIYDVEAHSMAIAEVYGTDRSAQAFSFSALWHDQLGQNDEAIAACEHVIQDLLPAMDPENTLGNFELLLNVIRVMKPKGQEKRMRRLLQDYVIKAFHKHHGPNGFTPCMSLFKPLVWLLDICADPANFQDLDVAVEWLMEDGNGISEEFLDSIYAKACWSAHDMIAELCLRVANRLALEVGDVGRQRVLIQKGLMLAWRSEKKMTDMEGNVILPIANEMHEPVFNALFEVARQMGLRCEEEDHPTPAKKRLDVNLPPSYLKVPDEGIRKS